MKYFQEYSNTHHTHTHTHTLTRTHITPTDNERLAANHFRNCDNTYVPPLYKRLEIRQIFHTFVLNSLIFFEAVERNRDNDMCLQINEHIPSLASHLVIISSTGFQKRVLQLLLDMRNEMRDVKHEVRDVKSVDRVTSFSDSGIDLTIKQSNTLEELQTVEKDLENTTYFQEMYSKCMHIGGMNKKDMVSKLLCSFMSKNLLCKYNMQGQRAKIAFKNT